MSLAAANDVEIDADAPTRLDRLPRLGFHTLVVAALGGIWILDGLEVTTVGSLSGAISERASLGLSAERRPLEQIAPPMSLRPQEPRSERP